MVFNLNDFGLWFELPTELMSYPGVEVNHCSHPSRCSSVGRLGSFQFLGVHSQHSWLPSANCWVPLSAERLLGIDGRHTPW